jgi:hypothetical protein
MSSEMGDVQGTRRRPWVLRTPDGETEFAAWRDPSSNPPAIVVRTGAVEFRYHLRCLNDLHEMLKEHGGWMTLGSADEQKNPAEGTVEAWARSPANPLKGWYGLKKGMRGSFASFIPPIMKALDLAEIGEERRRFRMRAT